MNDAELMWAAGFFDGEGHASTARGGYPQVMISQRDVRVLERFRDAVEVGRIYTTDFRGKPLYHYCSHSIATALRVVELLAPLVSPVKAAQFDRVLREYADLRMHRAVFGSAEHRAKMREAASKRPPRSAESEQRRITAVAAFYATPEGKRVRSDAAKLGWQRRKERSGHNSG